MSKRLIFAGNIGIDPNQIAFISETQIVLDNGAQIVGVTKQFKELSESLRAGADKTRSDVTFDSPPSSAPQ